MNLLGLASNLILPISPSQVARITGVSHQGPASLYFWFFETGSGYVAQTALELKILLPPPPKCWDYKCIPPHLALILFSLEVSSPSLWEP
jgi:hypothetical protein